MRLCSLLLLWVCLGISIVVPLLATAQALAPHVVPPRSGMGPWWLVVVVFAERVPAFAVPGLGGWGRVSAHVQHVQQARRHRRWPLQPEPLQHALAEISLCPCSSPGLPVSEPAAHEHLHARQHALLSIMQCTQDHTCHGQLQSLAGHLELLP